MASTIKQFVSDLKAYLANNKDAYYEHDSWVGDTENGFCEQDTFDFDKLCAEIDKFSEEFKNK